MLCRNEVYVITTDTNINRDVLLFGRVTLLLQPIEELCVDFFQCVGCVTLERDEEVDIRSTSICCPFRERAAWINCAKLSAGPLIEQGLKSCLYATYWRCGASIHRFAG